MRRQGKGAARAVRARGLSAQQGLGATLRPMYSPREALNEILARVGVLAAVESIPLAEAAGRVLAVDAVSDLDLPPFEKSAMDGFAVHSADFAGAALRNVPDPPAGQVALSLCVVGEARAGEPFAGAVPPGACVAIYTGAELPADVDAVVMVEDTEGAPGGERVLVRAPAGVRPGQNVCHRGQDLTRGGIVLAAGARIRPADVGVLAAVGCEPVPVVARPRVAILTTGDELVPPSARPGPGQIREGNTLHLAALSRAAGAEVVRCGILRDDPSELARAFGAALEECDALITTGGVSMGKYDLVGDALAELGVERVFHKVRIKPGKPLWFGMRAQVPVFALPGNPVSCLVGHAVFVRPALAKLGGDRAALDRRVGARPRARWAGPDAEPNAREQWLPARRSLGERGELEIAPVEWNGSGDVVGLARADALACVPMDTAVKAGEPVEFLEL